MTNFDKKRIIESCHIIGIADKTGGFYVKHIFRIAGTDYMECVSGAETSCPSAHVVQINEPYHGKPFVRVGKVRIYIDEIIRVD